MKKQSLVTGALLLGALGLSANEPGELVQGILVSKTDREAVVRNCSTAQLVTVTYGTAEAHTFLVGETVGYEYNAAGDMAIMIAHYPQQEGCGGYHS